MKSVKKWINRVSLVVFFAGVSYLAANTSDIPEIAHIESSGQLFNTLICILF
ncbi:MAG: hypothetical protein V2I33_11510 [Kangiellaceae bacterium]|jgi:hypothetical protein|nr:hypothetical protein [Kangiellaceae bacterium]